eukprot:364924-Chlamydomonas_euryale.AAC.1
MATHNPIAKSRQADGGQRLSDKRPGYVRCGSFYTFATPSTLVPHALPTGRRDHAGCQWHLHQNAGRWRVHVEGGAALWCHVGAGQGRGSHQQMGGQHHAGMSQPWACVAVMGMCAMGMGVCVMSLYRGHGRVCQGAACSTGMCACLCMCVRSCGAGGVWEGL